jgi:uncharacterized membrane protein YheB (UPF0754 family)
LKKYLFIISLASSILLLTACSEAKEKVVETTGKVKEEASNVLTELSEYRDFESNHNKTIKEYNDAFISSEEAYAEEDLNIVVERMEKETIPKLDSALAISKEMEFESDSFNELKEQRTNFILKFKEGIQMMILTYKDPNFTIEDEETAFKMLYESAVMLTKMEEDFMILGESLGKDPLFIDTK